ncbi:MAG: hypothetical protein M1313_09240 [Nitrospirae bacterium]|nr:hypothetical protein [Nitrospirota bacterium]
MKWSDRAYTENRELDNCLLFVKHNAIDDKRILITTKTVSGKIHYKNFGFHFVPSSLYAYIVGERSLSLKNKFANPNDISMIGQD